MAQASSSALAPAFAGRHEPKPLAFDPAKLTGLSERLIRSHRENKLLRRPQGAERDRATPLGHARTIPTSLPTSTVT